MPPSKSNGARYPTPKVLSVPAGAAKPDVPLGPFLGDAKVEKAFKGLSDTDRRVVELLSVFHAPTVASTMCSGLKRLGVRDSKRKAFTPKTLRTVLRRLERRGLVVRDQMSSCPPHLVDAITRSAQQRDTFERAAAVVQDVQPEPSRCYYFDDAVALLRIHLFRRDADALWKDWKSVVAAFPRVSQSPSGLLLGRAFDADWFATFPDEIQAWLLPDLADHALTHLTPMPGLFELLATAADTAVGEKDREDAQLSWLLAEFRLFRGELAELDAQVADWSSPGGHAICAVSKLLQGDVEAALSLFAQGMALGPKRGRPRKLADLSYFSPFYCTALLKTDNPQRYQQALEHLSSAIARKRNPMRETCQLLLHAIRPLIQDVAQDELEGHLNSQLHELPEAIFSTRWSYLRILWLGLAHSWHGKKAMCSCLPTMLSMVEERANASGFHWVASTAHELQLVCAPVPIPASKRNGSGNGQASARAYFSLAGPVATRPAWQKTLDALNAVIAPAQAEGGPAQVKPSRLVWRVGFANGDVSVRPIEQRRNAKGTWSKGRPVALKRLYENWQNLDWLSPQDRTVCALIQRRTLYEGYSRYPRETYVLDDEEACCALRGHPLVFLETAPTQRLDIVDGEPEVRVSAKKNGYQVEFLPASDDDVAVVRDGPNRLKVVEFNDIQQRLRRSLGQRARASIPAAGKTELASVLSAISPHIRIQSDLIAARSDDARAVPANAKPTVRLYPTEGGLLVELVVHPFADADGVRGPSYRCGVGGINVVAEVADGVAATDGAAEKKTQRLSTVRDLVAEIAARNALFVRAPVFSGLSVAASAGSSTAPDSDTWQAETEVGLDLVHALKNAGDMAYVEWPDGDPWRVHERLSLDSAKLRIRTLKSGFVVTGDAQLDDGESVEISSLATLLADSPGSYLQLEDGSFVALSEAFRERLDDLREFAELSDKGLVLPKLAAVAMRDIFDGAGRLRVDKGWREHLARLERIPTEAEVPKTLAAELRDYQLDGFRWMCKLAHWDVGACLADDMGLGKTVQALALLVHRAAQGPALVVAPTSVVPNWLDEAQRFAPTLRVAMYHGKGRRALLNDLGPFDVVVSSYAILQRDAKPLGAVSFHTAILDEAQAIKNRGTKRWKAAQGLKAEYRVMMTGTPVENRITELWNLFAILAPGLLGSPDRFAKRFANPIEKYGDRGARTRLSRLIKPFVLRRTKAQVLQQLPPRTDLVLHVDLSPEEAALYEAIREQALERIAGAGQTENARRMQIFAELMRLRRACCSPALVLPDRPAASAKLGVFKTLVEDLLSNGHRALVFSQFVDHLKLLCDDLDAAGHSYHYLDGSTPLKQRKQRIDAFQAGERDLFLISLKAGGVGLNLTGADYVVHMDPWWNPAVEDQASDRAHRIGQKRPVTVYRLVARGTIEERILELHGKKRALAEGLLDGTAETAALNADMLLQLIKEQRPSPTPQPVAQQG